MHSTKCQSKKKGKTKKANKDSKRVKTEFLVSDKETMTQEEMDVTDSEVDEISSVDDDSYKGIKRDRQSNIGPSQGPRQSGGSMHSTKCQSKKKGKTKKADKYSKRVKTEFLVPDKETMTQEEMDVTDSEVDEISSVDDDCYKGIKRWLNEYKKSRLGLKILQQKVDEFIILHEANEEQARKERVALAVDGGWTVVMHHKGRKKTVESESGIAVGSVSHIAVMENVAKKKKKEIPFDFYRFQKREARRNEMMILQSKFEHDKKRIQELRAARKFRPY